MQNQARFSSCRGVTFEIKPRADPFAITAAPEDEPNTSKKFWPSWNIYGNSSKMFPSSIQKSVSRASSHFRDLHNDVDDVVSDESHITLQKLEEGKNEEKDRKPIIPLASKREQPSKAARRQQSRLSLILLDQGLFTVHKLMFAVFLILNITAPVLARGGYESN